ncbi:MAG: PKD domain-containing protein [Ferruginibacter sp.]|nr:PKD domain-containing protein [Bacteroidota bacterium]MBX2919937.1 PKD domain-containing protein [Ferruginibacter sp.]MCB0710341.1 PKD domain-containing protein [Chitinophagaceae bacterium]
MTGNRIFTKQLMGLDYRVWRTMLIISIISLGLLSYTLIDSKKCEPVNFLIKTIVQHTDGVYNTGETLSFVSSSSKFETTWDFGDNTAKITGQYVTHIYKTAGEYRISASTGTGCETIQGIQVVEPVASAQDDNNVVTGQEIVGPSSTVTGKEEMFTCMVTAKSYDWSISNYPKMNQQGSTAKFQFPTPGKYLVQVTLDSDRTKRYTKEINVEAMPVAPSVTPDEVKPLIPETVQPLPSPTDSKNIKITDDIFKGYLGKVVDKKMTAADFDNYLCYKGDTKVILNGELMTFNAMCEEISGKKRRKLLIGKKKIKIEMAEMRRDKDGCVNIIEVKYH